MFTAKLIGILRLECLPVSKLPEGPEWSYEIKLDGFRLSAVKEKSETSSAGARNAGGPNTLSR